METMTSTPTQPTVEVYSRSIQTLMGRMPGFWARWSITLMLFFLLAFTLLLSQVYTNQYYHFTFIGASSLKVFSSQNSLPKINSPNTVTLTVSGAFNKNLSLEGSTCTYMLRPMTPSVPMKLLVGSVVTAKYNNSSSINMKIKVLRIKTINKPYTDDVTVSTNPKSVLSQAFSSIFHHK